jgi:SAM-dependent methyltransferase
VSPEQARLMTALKESYGVKYNDGKASAFGGYPGQGHFENQPRWARSALGLVGAYLQLQTSWPLRSLDVGCGRGTLVYWLRTLGVRAFGVDLGFDFAYAPACAQANALQLPFGTKQFEMMSALDLIEHVPADLQTELFRELTRVTRGLILTTVPTLGPRYVFSSDAGPRNHYIVGTVQDWRDHFKGHGLTVVAEGDDLKVLGPPFDHGADNYPFALSGFA